MIQRDAVDLTSRSLRKATLEERACHARRSEMDRPAGRNGRDKRVPPKSFPFPREICRPSRRARPHPCRHIGGDVILKFRLIRPSFEQHSENLVGYLEITLLLRDGSYLWAQRKLVKGVEKLAARSAGCGPRFGIARSDVIAFLDQNGSVFLCADRRD